MSSSMTASRFAVRLLGFVAVAALGVACLVVPTIVAKTPLKPAPLFPLLLTSIENIGWPALVSLTGLGVIAGAVARVMSGSSGPRSLLSPLLIAIASVSLLPIAMFAEIVKDGTSHNLFPFELVMYAFLSLPALLGAFIGHGIASLASRNHAPLKKSA